MTNREECLVELAEHLLVVAANPCNSEEHKTAVRPRVAHHPVTR